MIGDVRSTLVRESEREGISWREESKGALFNCSIWVHFRSVSPLLGRFFLGLINYVLADVS